MYYFNERWIKKNKNKLELQFVQIYELNNFKYNSSLKSDYINSLELH